MPGKKKSKGGNARKNVKNRSEESSRDIVFREEGQDYGQICRTLGDKRFDVLCLSDGKRRQCRVRGALRKRCFVRTGDVVLVGLRDFQDAKADILQKYTDNEVRNLRIYKEIPDWVVPGTVSQAGALAGAAGGGGGGAAGSSLPEQDCVFDFDAI